MSPRPRRRRPRPGVTLVELLVALVLLAVGLLALAGGAAGTLRTLGAARLEADAATLVARRFELLRATPCPARTDGEGTAGPLHEAWVVTLRPDSSATLLDVTVRPAGQLEGARTWSTVAPC